MFHSHYEIYKSYAPTFIFAIRGAGQMYRAKIQVKFKMFLNLKKIQQFFVISLFYENMEQGVCPPPK